MPKKGFNLRWELLREIAEDLRYLLERGYHKEASINFLANRWQLSALEREVLKRGVFSQLEAQLRLSKKKDPAYLKNKILYIDGFNVLTTIRSALAGLPVFMCDDGFIRDLGKLTPKFTPNEVSEKAILLLLRKLKQLRPKRVEIYLDKPLSRSGELAAKLREFFEKEGILGEVILTSSADKALIGVSLLASSDAALLDRAEAAFDLAASILEEEGYRWPYLSSYYFSEFEDRKIK
ncbi:protein of unknown function DUF434 [Thermodesulfatator indicus DSM 15286]|uniref:DUF434 domain-containing protein n=1 Tax=Thermodesulfatator indicus (strain DSM 15286 / JCM 11887 / CIR29812) TaxID=667014 RepID=F8AE42_THEID|nr:DUF434 domain-containing protein [Thermodesulfatator indicus]AEH44035.1 protein of unknown function DUF434 [Thermodesulfatator indicus DSM 15286]